MDIVDWLLRGSLCQRTRWNRPSDRSLPMEGLRLPNFHHHSSPFKSIFQRPHPTHCPSATKTHRADLPAVWYLLRLSLDLPSMPARRPHRPKHETPVAGATLREEPASCHGLVPVTCALCSCCFVFVRFLCFRFWAAAVCSKKVGATRQCLFWR